MDDNFYNLLVLSADLYKHNLFPISHEKLGSKLFDT